MEEEPRPRLLPDLLRYLTKAHGIVVMVVGLAAVGGSIISWIEKDNPAIALTVLAILAWPVLLYGWLATTEEYCEEQDEWIRVRKYSLQTQRISRLGVVGIPIAAMVAISFWMMWPRDDRLLILVARFAGQDEQLTSRFFDELDPLSSDHSKLIIIRHDDSTPVSSEDADKLGRERGAAIVIWGWQGHGCMNAKVEILAKAPKGLIPTAIMRAVPELGSTEVAQDPRLLASLVVALAYYHRQEHYKAIEVLTEAIDPGYGSKDAIDLLLLYRGICYSYVGEYVNAIQDFDRILSTTGNPPGNCTLRNRKQPGDVMIAARIGRANALVETRDLSGAADELSSLKEAVGEEPQFKWAILHNLGSVTYRIGMQGEAIRAASLTQARNEYIDALNAVSGPDPTESAVKSKALTLRELGKAEYALALSTPSDEAAINWLREAEEHITKSRKLVKYEEDVEQWAIKIELANIEAYRGSRLREKKLIANALPTYKQAKAFFDSVGKESNGPLKGSQQALYAEVLYGIGYYQMEIASLAPPAEARDRLEESIRFLEQVRSIFCDEAVPPTRRCRKVTDVDLPKARAALNAIRPTG